MGEDVALLARFVRCLSLIYPYLNANRLVADALKASVNELRKEDEKRMSRYVSTVFRPASDKYRSVRIDSVPSLGLRTRLQV